MTHNTKLHSLTRRQTLLGSLGVVGAGALPGCATPSVQTYAAGKPVFDLRRYFDGKVSAHGMFTDRSGRIVRRFTVAMDCSWKGQEGVLDEAFVYDDGERQRRVWRLTDLGSGRFTGRADDVVGEAKGEQAGHAFRWTYTLRLPVNGREWEVQFDDWMVMVDQAVVLNRASMSKWGIALGEVTLAFHK